jgi:hypothetical protein
VQRFIVIALTFGLASPTFAEDPAATEYPIDLAGVVADSGASVDKLTLVGRSGQVYEPTEAGWQRTHPGGVAADVAGAVRVGSTLYAIGNRAPIYELKNKVWIATPLPNRGTAALSIGGHAGTAAVGRHIYQLKANKWERLTTAERRVTSLWAGSSKKIYVATTRGRLRFTDGKKWAVIRNAMATEDSVFAMRGAKNGEVYGLASSGLVLWVHRPQAQEVLFEGDLADFSIHAMGTGRGGQVVLAGVDSGGTARLLGLAKGAVKVLDDLPALTEGDRFTVVVTDKKGTVLVGTRSGRVQLSAQKGTWQDRPIGGRLAAQTPEIPPGSAPARAH